MPHRWTIASTETGCWTHCSKHQWQNFTWWGKSSILRPCTRCIWYGYSWSSCSILQTVLQWTPPAEDILWVLVPGLAATWARIHCSRYTVLAVRGLPPSITGMNVPFSSRRAMREKVRLHGSRRFGCMEVDDSEMFLDTDSSSHVHCCWHDHRRNGCLPSQKTCSLQPPSWSINICNHINCSTPDCLLVLKNHKSYLSPFYVFIGKKWVVSFAYICYSFILRDIMPFVCLLERRIQNLCF